MSLKRLPTLQQLCVAQMSEKDRTLLCSKYKTQFPDFVDEIREKEIEAKDYLVDIFDELYITQFYSKYYKTMYRLFSIMVLQRLLSAAVCLIWT